LRVPVLLPSSARWRTFSDVIRTTVLCLLLGLGTGATTQTNASAAAPGVVLNEIYYHPKDRTSSAEFIELFNPTKDAVPLAGWKIDDGVRFTFPLDAQLPAGGYVVVARDPQAFKAEFHREALGPWAGKLKHSGETLTLKDAQSALVDSVKFAAGFPWPTAAAGEGSSLELVHPAMDRNAGSSWRASGFAAGQTKPGRPTPGERNSVATDTPPPSISAIGHVPIQPHGGEPVRVGARITAPGGIKNATLLYQVVEPGQYIRKSDAAFEKEWTAVPMHDDGKDGDARAGDGVYSVTLPAALQQHRRLIRYRIAAEDAAGQTVRVPYADDGCPNFAYFCYNGAPAWTGFPGEPGKGTPWTFPASLFGTLPAMTLLAVKDDVEHSQWDPGWNKRKISGTLIADGRVYDHMTWHNRGQASTYVSGKNKWGFKFNRTHDFQPAEFAGHPLTRGMDSLSMNACASPWVQTNRGMAGLDEAVSFRAYELAGVPASRCRHVQFRVIDAPQEQTANQYVGDLWGLYLLVEDPDGGFLDERGLPDGTVYRMAGGGDKKHQGATMPKDHSDVDAFMNQVRRSPDEAWWRANVDLPVFYSFHAISRLTGNVDLREGENHYLYHRPDGKWVVMPWDLDMMFIPKSHQSGRTDLDRILDVPALRAEYRNRCREIVDLLCDDPSPRGGQFGQMVDEFAALLHPPGQPLAWPELDQCLWNFHPHTSDKGAFYRNPVRGGPDNNWDRKLATPDFAGFVKFITDFGTPTRPADHPWKQDDGDPRGYGYGWLVADAADPDIPERPRITSSGPTGFPCGALAFSTTPFASRKSGAQFAALQWRLGEIAAPGLPGWQPGHPRRYEIESAWTSAEISSFTAAIQIPADAAHPGATYRARVRMKDTEGRWSRWSEPVQFTTAVR